MDFEQQAKFEKMMGVWEKHRYSFPSFRQGLREISINGKSDSIYRQSLLDAGFTESDLAEILTEFGIDINTGNFLDTLTQSQKNCLEFWFLRCDTGIQMVPDGHGHMIPVVALP
ncbi:MAG: hypothetical protein ACTSVZ_03145, partial [Promethearchaeota archaeon]